MIELVKAGDTVKIRVLLFDGVNPVEGETVKIVIERLSDNKFFDGTDYDPGTYVELTMTEKTGNNHYKGIYEYSFTTESTPDVYDWSVTHAVAGTAYSRKFVGRISTAWTHWTQAITELSGLISATATPFQIVTMLLMLMRNEVTVTAAQLSMKNDAGTTVMKSALSDDATTFTRAEMVAGP